jgi:hypothetical protein
MIGFAIVSSLPDVRLTTANPAGTWYTLAGRIVSLNKVSASSKLRITYQDTLGTRANYYNSCQWRIVLDNVATLSSFSTADGEGQFGWRMQNGAHIAWAFDVPAGPHQIRVDNVRLITGNDCLSGWNTTGNFLSIEEIP